MAGGLDVALRRLRRRPVFTAAVVANLALGIGGSVTLFSAVNAVLWRALPYAAPDRLVMVWAGDPAADPVQKVVSYPDFLDWRRDSRQLDLAAWNIARDQVAGPDGPEELRSALVTPNFFSVLGAPPARGRAFAAEGSRGGAQDQRSAVVSDRFWRERLGGREDALGAKVVLSGLAYTVIGVMPPSFEQPEPFSHEETDLWRPLVLEDYARARGFRYLRVVGRLRAAAGLAAAGREMEAIGSRLALAYPLSNRGRSISLVPLRRQLFGDLRLPLLVATALALAVLAIGCLNVASLQLARATSLEEETGVRLALGATPRRLLRLALGETLLLVPAGGALGLLLVVSGNRLLAAAPPSLRGLQHAALDGRVLAFAGALTLAVAVVSGAAPVLAWSRSDPGRLLGSWSRGGGRRRRRGQHSLLVAEIAAALPVLVAAALLARSALALTHLDPGFHPGHVLTFRCRLPAGRYGGPNQASILYQELLRRLAALSRVRAAGAVSSLALTGDNDLVLELLLAPGERPGDGRESRLPAHLRSVAGQYFEALGIPLLAGRGFRPGDGMGAASVAVVSAAFARASWGSRPAVGRVVRFPGMGTETPVTVIGVAGDLRDPDLTQPPVPIIYLPHPESPETVMAVVLATRGEPLEVLPAVRRELASLDPGIVVADIAPLADIVAHATLPWRFNAWAVSALAALALGLATIGIFGVTAYLTGERRREFGIRLVLGARRRAIVTLILRRALAVSSLGLLLGALLLPLVTRALARLVFGVDPLDGPSLALAAGALVLATIAGASLPAALTSRVDPAASVRQ